MTFYTPEQLGRPRRVIGLMSGTSVDGIDAAAVEITGMGDAITPRLAAFVTVPFDPGLREAVHAAFGARGNAAKLTALHVALGLAFADAVIQARAAAGWKRHEVDTIGSHGQTVWHQPEPVEVAGAFVSGTMQIGDPATIAERTGTTVVSDFRARDMAAGGQGAPLVPLVDWLLYRRPGVNRALLNIGGIANVTWLPRDENLDHVLAFDTGPGNMIIDAAMDYVTQGHKTYDVDGAFAAKGKVHEWVLEQCLAHPYYQQHPPKSTGHEMFGWEYAEPLVRALRPSREQRYDAVATITALTAETIARAFRDFLPEAPDEVVVGGGGARNPTLMRMLRERMPVPLLSNEDLGWNGDAKEAVAFAILADLTMQGLPGNVPSATGASRPVVLGSVTPGR